ncbi:MAG: bifunctional (p)ppGpp synthetase/guanosine-3',5'-bis(diphosphate) 3'-pyrophosphohydrolase [Bacteroidia bacterium]|nr:bifunctional (p)ppGpp synthetase/guanosine-3',5'-bis(diphosphate) 3'-pyrophosphohydrolase [Bacteroidia bacterium]
MNAENIRLYRNLYTSHSTLFTHSERKELSRILKHFLSEKKYGVENPEAFLKRNLEIMDILLNEIGLGKAAVISFLLMEPVEKQYIDVKDVDKLFSTAISPIMIGLQRVKELYQKNVALESENFRKLLLTMAEDVRVILIIVAVRLQTMRNLESYPTDEQQQIARESSFLYAPLAHRMGLYKVKTELEDLSLKFTDREIYKAIARKLNETKRSRDAYMNAFIEPLKKEMEEIGFPFEIKGRTKSIHSIYSKMQKQNTTFENIYDLFAIRIIFDTPIEKEKAACWQAYSIVADMYQPNPKRLRDWLSIPKSNGYESLHTTVLGPQNKWVEVQIRTARMNEVAEMGLAAHWKYKGIKSESGMDEWLKNIREILENPDLNAVDFMDEFKLNLYDKEVFVFTPNGDLHKLPKDATLLDFAFSIHTNLGTQCVGGKVNGKHVQIKYVLNNGDQVEVLTSPTQKPNPAWLNIVTTSKAKNKIRQSLKEVEFKDAEIGRETLIRRFKNWKIELEDGRFSRISKKMGYKTVSDLYQAIAHEKVDIHEVRELYLELETRDNTTATENRTAENFVKEVAAIPETASKEDVLVIDNNLRNVDYKLAKCCNPIYGDEIFGFVSVMGGIKIHRTNCPNAPQMISRFGYRIIKARWSGKSEGSQYPITLRVVGHDDIGIVTNITSIISKEKEVMLRSISIDTNAGLFQGNLTVMVNDNKSLDDLIKKVKNVKGVKNVSRT